jgi:hypothetical protein
VGLISFNIETKERSKQWTAHKFIKEVKKNLNEVVFQKAHGNSSVGQEGSADGGIYATRDHFNI